MSNLKTKEKMKKALFLLAVAAVFAACGGKTETPTETVVEEQIEQVETVTETVAETPAM